MPRPASDRKQRKTFTLSRQALGFLEAARKEARSPSTSAVLEQIIRDRQQQRERQETNAAISRYYDSLTAEERHESRLWGEFSEEQIAAEE
jgi:hypothetical protein